MADDGDMGDDGLFGAGLEVRGAGRQEALLHGRLLLMHFLLCVMLLQDGDVEQLELLDAEGEAVGAEGDEEHGAGSGKSEGGAAGKAVEASQRVTSRYMTKYERARILGTRALQLRLVLWRNWCSRAIRSQCSHRRRPPTALQHERPSNGGRAR